MNGIANISQKLRNLKVVIVTHVFATGPAQELEEYLKERVKFLIFIGHPFSFAMDTRSFYRIYNNGRLIKEKRAFNWNLPELFMYFKDVFCTLFWMMGFSKKFDLYVGADPLNALTGIILKKLGKAKKIIFYTVDYVPRRFDNKFLNWIYHKIDSFCAEESDFVWDLSERMIEARKEKGVRKIENQMVVPIGVHFERIKRLEIHQINRKSLVYMGHLRKRQGLELIIDSLPEIVKKIPEAKLIIIGTGELERCLKKKVEELKLENYVEFRGYIEDHKEVENILTTCAVGLALYEPKPDNFTWYADPSKPKQYMACGLPVIITWVPWIAEEVKKKKMGLVIDYERNKFVDAVVKLLEDEDFYKKCRENAIEFVSEMGWDRVFEKALMRCLGDL